MALASSDCKRSSQVANGFSQGFELRVLVHKQEDTVPLSPILQVVGDLCYSPPGRLLCACLLRAYLPCLSKWRWEAFDWTLKLDHQDFDFPASLSPMWFANTRYMTVLPTVHYSIMQFMPTLATKRPAFSACLTAYGPPASIAFVTATNWNCNCITVLH